MKPAANFIIHFVCSVRSRLSRIEQASGHAHDAGFAAMPLDNHAAHVLHRSVIRMRSRLQSV